ISTWGTYGINSGELAGPNGIAMGTDERYVYVADSGNNRIQKFNTKGRFVIQWGRFGKVF
ncbi:MAG: 6-bladed beta-propeller, partial [Candidatus Eremiobacterota bacterium]